jgi:hypothetical protein
MNSLAFVDALNKKFEGHYEFSVEAGRKFDRIVQQHIRYGDRFGSGRSVHAFVERATGDLIKPAGWSQPAKWKSGWATNFNLVTQFEQAVEAADFAGGYLYQE